MFIESLETIAEKLAVAKVRFLVVGGLAVSAHGYPRVTHDVDLVVQLERGNLERALKALAELEYVPVPPVGIMEFADPENRSIWIRDKSMMVFMLASPSHPQAPIDIFANEPFDFDQEYARAMEAPLGPAAPVRFVCLDTLIAMKIAAGRHRDLDDVEHLRSIQAVHSCKRARDNDDGDRFGP